MKWTQEADELVCQAYLDGRFDDAFAKMISEKYGHSVASIKMRVSNYSFLHTGVGLEHCSRQEEETYRRLIQKRQ